ncbi:MAG: glycogen synthase [Candidatus Levybacteria bacterium]|nr:glycogen synthase [Candidatus Levybacteria bacterium]
MKILFVAAEVAPFSTVGGLSQVMYFLPRALRHMKHDVRIFTPKYGVIDEKNVSGKWKFTMLYEGLRVPVGESRQVEIQGKDKEDFLICNVKYFHAKESDPDIYFLENREYYELRANVFGYGDDHIRFALLSKGFLEFFLQIKRLSEDSENKQLEWWPDLIHCNDWHTGYLIEMMRRDPRYAPVFEKIPVVYTVHNFAYQGNFDFRYAPPADKDNGNDKLLPMLDTKMQKQNALLRGIRFSDAISTVSPSHAVEVLTPEFAEGLEEELIKARGKLAGILNGLDTKEFNPTTDPIIKRRYGIKTFQRGRAANKKDLQKLFFLPENENVPVIVSCGRLSTQKGWDLLLTVLPHVLTIYPGLQIIALGSSDQSNYRDKLQLLKQDFPQQIGLHLRGDFRLPRKLYAGGDIILIPSYFEPGGIVALEALRYGCVPLVRRTGGLNDIIEDFNPEKQSGNGFSFSSIDPWALYAKIVEALTFYRQKTLWRKLVIDCLESDFSWEHAAKEYDLWYRQVIASRKRAVSETPHPAYKATA